MKSANSVYLAIIAIILLFLAPSARGDSAVQVTLAQGDQIAAPGSTITFDGTITNLSSTDIVYLNGDTSVTSSTFLVLDDTPYLTNFPLSLDPNEASGPFGLFNILIDPSAPEGVYDFNSFSILGGVDDNMSEPIGTTSFSVTVANTIATPEPGALILIVTGILWTVVFARVYQGNVRRQKGSRT